tara:strand:+ start:209 stop:511 length:303 start_codon:yes stop_codon:yes gene_type:complete
MSDRELIELIDNTDWIFAKTYAKVAPHYYIRRRSSTILFWALLERIRNHGKEEYFSHTGTDGKFRESNFSYYYFEGYKYWTIDPYDPFCIIINRVEVENA